MIKSTFENKIRSATIPLMIEKLDKTDIFQDDNLKEGIISLIAKHGFKIENLETLENEKKGFEIIKLKLGDDKTISKKPINIFLNWGSLIRSLPELSLTTIGAFTEPYVFVISAFALFLKLDDIAEIQLSKIEGEMCKNVYQNKDMTEENLLQEIIKDPNIDIEKANMSIEKLIKIKALKRLNEKLILIEEFQIG